MHFTFGYQQVIEFQSHKLDGLVKWSWYCLVTQFALGSNMHHNGWICAKGCAKKGG